MNRRRLDARIDRAGELGVLHHPDRLARERREPFALPRLLHTALDHAETQCMIIDPFRLLPIHRRLQAILQRAL